MLYDNPAARLKAILEIGNKVQAGTICRQAWEHILKVEAGNTADLFAKLGKTMELPRKTIILVQTHFPHQVDSCKLWSDPIENGFLHQAMNGPWNSFTQHLNPYCLPQLGLIADLLHSKLSAKVIKDDDLSKIIDDFKALDSLIIESTLSEQLKNYLIQEISDLIHTVRTYKVTGAMPILKQAESMAGHVLLDPEYANFLKNHDLGKRLLDNLNAAAAILTVAVSLPQLSNFSKLLLN